MKIAVQQYRCVITNVILRVSLIWASKHKLRVGIPTLNVASIALRVVAGSCRNSSAYLEDRTTRSLFAVRTLYARSLYYGANFVSFNVSLIEQQNVRSPTFRYPALMAVAADELNSNRLSDSGRSGLMSLIVGTSTFGWSDGARTIQ